MTVGIEHPPWYPGDLLSMSKPNTVSRRVKSLNCSVSALPCEDYVWYSKKVWKTPCCRHTEPNNNQAKYQCYKRNHTIFCVSLPPFLSLTSDPLRRFCGRSRRSWVSPWGTPGRRVASLSPAPPTVSPALAGNAPGRERGRDEREKLI